MILIDGEGTKMPEYKRFACNFYPKEMMILDALAKTYHQGNKSAVIRHLLMNVGTEYSGRSLFYYLPETEYKRFECRLSIEERAVLDALAKMHDQKNKSVVIRELLVIAGIDHFKDALFEFIADLGDCEVPGYADLGTILFGNGEGTLIIDGTPTRMCQYDFVWFTPEELEDTNTSSDHTAPLGW